MNRTWIGWSRRWSVLPMRNLWLFRGKFDKHLSLDCGAVKPKLQTGLGYWFMWESCEIWFLEVTANFGIVSSKNALKSNYNYNPIEITWRKTVCSVCLKPVSMATWRWHTLWRFTLPANSLNWGEKEFEFFLLYPRDRHLGIICMTIACARFASTFVSKITYAFSFAYLWKCWNWQFAFFPYAKCTVTLNYLRNLISVFN